MFKKKGFHDPIKIRKNNFILYIYKKQHFDSINVIQNHDSFLYVIGSCFYKYDNYTNGLQKILADFINGEFNPDKLVGSYFLLFYHNNTYQFYSDRAAIQNIFYHQDSGIISSSFLACIAGAAKYTGKLKLNKKALTEVLITGNLIGPDTLVEEIFRYEHSLCKDLPGLNRVLEPYQNETGKPAKIRLFTSEVNNQINVLIEFLSALKPVYEEIGATTGLTGGFDSRLLLLALRKSTKNYRVYSTYRPSPTKEVLCARKFAKSIGDQLYSPKHSSFKEMTSQKFMQLLVRNFYFNDGLIRTHQLWTEELKSKAYLADLYADNKIALSAVGGEQYRNNDLLIKKKYKFNKWFFYELIYRNCKNPFVSNEKKHEWLQYVHNKIYDILELDHDNKYISRFDIKRFYNEIYNPANRVIRNNIENQLCFFLSPFTDYNISRKAYEAFKHLGWHHEFEKEMIRQLAPDLAHIELDYGYSIRDRVPLKYAVAGALKTLVGENIFFWLHGVLKQRGHTIDDFCRIHNVLKDYLYIVDNLDLPITLSGIKDGNRLSPLIIEAGIFIDEVKKYVSCD
ncbi:MAG: hypothetical protein K8R74_12985 [Bacteroidales bacterium]|nr:hypothetical protein [Bacteroidales bacterium]